jgi:hypothetical protein
MEPEDKERWVEIKRISRDSMLGSLPAVAPGRLTTNGISKQCFQKILVFAFQMEEFKQDNGWGEVE